MPLKSNHLHSFAEAKVLMAEYIRHYQPSRIVARLEIKIKPIDQINWLSCQEAEEKVFGANQEDSAAIAGVGAACVVKGGGRINFPKVFGQLRRYLTPDYSYLQWYGGFAFEGGKTDAAWSSFGSWRFVLPRFELARDKSKMIFCCSLIGCVDKAKLLKELAGLKNPVAQGRGDLKADRRCDYPNPKVWQNHVQGVLKNIKAGRCQKVVLARKTVLSFKQQLDPWAMLKSLKKVTPRSYHFAFQFGQSTFLGSSPERLYKRYGRLMFSEALAGTKPKSVHPNVLLRSAKDQHEHHLVVEAIAQSLSPLCRQLAYAPKPKVLTFSNGHHLNTKFQGHLKDGIKDEDVLQSLHPTPALGGTPRRRALAAIRRLEPFSRGWYGGPLGYVGLDWAEFVVGIRSGLVKGKNLSVFAGAGIVQGSQPRSEWDEIENKISNFLKIVTT